MAKSKAKVRTYKVDYKKLEKEIKKTLMALRKIKGRVVDDEESEIELQIEHLNYMAGVCAKGPGRMTKEYRAKMTGCETPKA
jgi:hypothetical protein